MSQPFYRAFEDRYRGAREVIKQRLGAYAPFLAPLLRNLPGANAIDLGCGRGEWLELLGEHGYRARGVDLDDSMLAACRERGLDVATADALAALRALPDASVALVSAFHLVEHIPFDVVRELVAQALRVLQPGGLLIMETPNPENLVVGASSFYMDPSHLRPLPPSLLAFAAEHAGYARHKIVRLQEDPALHSDPQLGLINVLEGPSPDYSVIAQKDGPPPAMAALAPAFDADYGIALAPLAQRYEQQQADDRGIIHRALARIDGRIDDAHRSAAGGTASLEQADQLQRQQLQQLQEAQQRQQAQHQEQSQQSQQRLHQLEQRLQAAEVLAERTQQRMRAAEVGVEQTQQRALAAEALAEQTRQRVHAAELRAEQMAQHIHAAELRAEQLGQRVVDLLSSSSWRITAPLRRAGDLARRLRGAAKRRLRALVVRSGQAALRRPALKRLARAALRHLPGLQARLYALLLSHQAAPATLIETVAESASIAPGQLSPRAARCYHALKQVQATINTNKE